MNRMKGGEGEENKRLHSSVCLYRFTGLPYLPAAIWKGLHSFTCLHGSLKRKEQSTPAKRLHALRKAP
eukprot:scaffold41593_cov21-Tisochrysis_lutea.AAC.1